MEQKKKKHHYVWRHYLKAWAQDESIWCYFKKNGEIKKNALMNVAQQRYFYKLVDLTEEEVQFFERFIKASSARQVLGLNMDFLFGFTSVTRLKKSFQNNTNPDIDRKSIQAEIDIYEANLMENTHGKFEEMGRKLVSCRSFHDLTNLDNGENLYDAVIFLCVQYFRTNNMRLHMLKTFENDPFEDLATKGWNIVSHVMATTFATHICLSKEIQYVFLENNTPTHFVTGDQPVFNLRGDDTDENGDVQELEFYYPLTPHHAIKVILNSQLENKFLEIAADEKMVSELNHMVMQNADFFIFGDSEDGLEPVKNLYQHLG